MKAYITAETMTKAYKLHKKGVDNATIAQVLSCSTPTVERLTRIMRIGESGDVEALENVFGRGCYKRMKRAVREIYGLCPDPGDATPDEATPADTARPASDSNAAFDTIIDLLKRQNALLERFCAAFGVTETGGAE